MIGIGAVILYLNVDSECDDCNAEEAEDFVDNFKSTAKMGYGFIMIGGFLTAFGI